MASTTLPFNTVDVFTKTRYAGNPLAIVQLPPGTGDHGALSTPQMQRIAQEFNLSETVFIAKQQDKDGVPEWRLRIFMTAAELPFAGHPTIGAACFALGTLAQGAAKGRLVCNAGPVEVDFADGVARASIPVNFHRHVESGFGVEGVLGLQPGLGKEAVQAVDVVSPVKGMNFIAVRLASLEELEKVGVTGVKPRAKLDREWDVGFCGSYFYVVTDQKGEEVKVRTRMVEGSIEDPATGSAACGLSCYLASAKGQKTTKFEISQGVEMGRKSEIGVEVTLAEGGKEVERVVLSGSAVGVMEGKLEV